MGDRTRGIYHKFNVTRTDGTSAPGGKHDSCFYFVLDLDHDPHAKAALKAYADSCRDEYPKLAADLDMNVAGYDFGRAPNDAPVPQTTWCPLGATTHNEAIKRADGCPGCSTETRESR